MREKLKNLRSYFTKDPKHMHHALLVCSAILFIAVYTGFQVSHQPGSKADSDIVYVPTSGSGAIPDSCSQPAGQAIPDESAALASFIDSQPAGTTIEFPNDGCYLVQEKLTISAADNVTINGNGSTFERTNQAINSTGNVDPMVYLYSDEGTVLENLNINGGNDGNNFDGAGYEGSFGILLEADSNIVINAVNVSNVGGDGINLQFETGKGTALNQNVLVTNSTFTNMGYHGLTLEAVNGVTLANDTFTRASVDSMDYEYDDYSSTIVNGVATGAAEDNVNILNNNWIHNGYDWLASMQGQYPGVQEQNLVFSGNQISDTTQPFIQLGGTNEINPNTTTTNQLYWFDNIDIQNNDYTGGSFAKPTNGGTPGKDWVDNIGDLKYVGNVVITNNTVPVQLAENHVTPYLGVFRVTYANGLTIEDNNFTGALGLINPDDSSGLTDANGDSLVTDCGNSVGNPGAVADGACAAAPCAAGLVGAPPNCRQPTPSIPTSVTANAANSTTVNLNWTASTPETGDSISGYYIYRSTATSPQQVIGQVSGTTTSYSDTTAAPGVTYNYVVESYDNQQPTSISQASTVATVTTPSSSSATPSNPVLQSANIISQGEIDLSWTASTDSGGPGVAGYYIIRNGQIIASTTGTTFQDLTTLPLTSYNYEIQAYDSGTPSLTSGDSNAISQTTPINPSRPPKFNVSSTQPNAVDLSWNISSESSGPGVAGYYIYRDGATTPTYTVTNCTVSPCSFTDTTGISPDTTYTYTIASFDSATPIDVSFPSDPASVTTPTGVTYPPPNAPVITSVANQTDGSVKINWSAATSPTGGDGIGGYNVYRTYDGVTTEIDTTTRLVYGDSTVQPDTSYTYYVEAIDNNVPADVSAPSECRRYCHNYSSTSISNYT